MVGHVVRHKVPWFWYFHSVHHAQRSLNAFSDTRYHPVEYQTAQLIRYLPLVLLRVPVPVVIGWGLVARWYARTYHANVRLNLACCAGCSSRRSRIASTTPLVPNTAIRTSA
jgi:sterol desaturase/sphingolipid hydroxylase (fatty acid hydroxylase superfamily)